MALALDNDTHGSASTDELTVSHTVSGSDTLLLVFAYGRSSSVNFDGGCTYNGVPMVQEYGATQQSLGLYVFSLIAPADGIHDVVLSASFSTQIALHVISLNGADQADAVEVVQNANGAANSPTLSITTLTDGAWAIDGFLHESGTVHTKGAGQTLINVTSEPGGSWDTGSSYEPKASAGAVTMDWTGNSDKWHQAAVSVKPVVGVVEKTKTFTIDGVVKEVKTKTFTIDGVVGLNINARYILNSLNIPRPKELLREIQYIKIDAEMLDGKTKRDVSTGKEKFILTWHYLTKAEVDLLEGIVALDQPVTFKVEDGSLQIGETSVHTLILDKFYGVQGSDYLGKVVLKLQEVT